MTILGAASPEPGSNTPEGQKGLNAEEVAHIKGSGHGIVVLDRAAHTVTFELWRHGFDAAAPNARDQFEGFPVRLQLNRARQQAVVGRESKDPRKLHAPG